MRSNENDLQIVLISKRRQGDLWKNSNRDIDRITETKTWSALSLQSKRDISIFRTKFVARSED